MVVMTPDALVAHYTADPSDHLVGPFEAESEKDMDKEEILTRYCAYAPHNLGHPLDPIGGLTPSYFFRNIYQLLLSEGGLAAHQHLIHYFQVAATAKVKEERPW